MAVSDADILVLHTHCAVTGALNPGAPHGSSGLQKKITNILRAAKQKAADLQRDTSSNFKKFLFVVVLILNTKNLVILKNM
jgi:hypothetical protein